MRSIILSLGLLSLTTPALSAPISFTGVEFAALPGITFPTGTQTIIGDSLRIEASERNSAIASLPLDQFNLDASDFEVQINITRVLRGDGVADQNIFIYLSDGRNLFGGVFVDTPDSVIAQSIRDELASDGQSLIDRENLGVTSNAPVPIGGSYLATIGVQATATNTLVTTAINNSAANGNTNASTTLFDPNNGGPNLVLFSNDFNHNYLINSVTFVRGVSAPTAVAEPGALGGLALGLGMLGCSLYRRRFV